MRTRTILLLVLVIIILVGAIIVLAPMETKAPTTGTNTQSTTTATSPTPIPAPAATPAAASLPDVIVVNAPLPNEKIASPFTISGKARGTWFFEATAPVVLKDASGTVIGHGTLRADNWMTSDFVDFTGTLTFSAPATHTGTLILTNDNPSGDPKRQKELDIPVEF
jgi:hypothetical protein